MLKVAEKAPAQKSGHVTKPGFSEIGRKLRRIRNKIEASGEKMLTLAEFEREMTDRRTGNV